MAAGSTASRSASLTAEVDRRAPPPDPPALASAEGLGWGDAVWHAARSENGEEGESSRPGEADGPFAEP